MKGGAHPSPFVALSFPDSKKVPIYCWVDRHSFPVVAWRGPGSNSRPYGDFLHHNRAALTFDYGASLSSKGIQRMSPSAITGNARATPVGQLELTLCNLIY